MYSFSLPSGLSSLNEGAFSHLFFFRFYKFLLKISCHIITVTIIMKQFFFSSYASRRGRFRSFDLPPPGASLPPPGNPGEGGPTRPPNRLRKRPPHKGRRASATIKKKASHSKVEISIVPQSYFHSQTKKITPIDFFFIYFSYIVFLKV